MPPSPATRPLTASVARIRELEAESQRNAEALAQAERTLSHLALHDALTGLANRAQLEEELMVALARAAKAGQTVSVHFMDVDRFKTVNESFGHDTGDEILRVLAARLEQLAGEGDTLARFGGDEFVLVSRLRDPEAEAEAIAQRLLDALAEPVGTAAGSFALSCSIGVALGRDFATAQDLIRDADTAMYQAKDTGGGVFAFFETSLHGLRVRELELEQDLRRAISLDQLRVHFQPIVSLPGEGLAGFEALVRWEHPARGLLAPDEFIAMAERTGLIVDLGRWVLREACRQIAVWTGGAEAPAWARVAVNVSAVQLSTPAFLEDIRLAIAATGIEADRLALEITESALMDTSSVAADTLKAVHAMGIRVLLDDFGTGYSSLGYLTRFPIDGLKLDRAFVSGESDVNRPIVEAVAGMAHSLGITLVAEGVETAEQGELLVALGCDYAQGYLFSRPMPGERVVSWAATRGLQLPEVRRVSRAPAGELVSLGDAAQALSVSASTVRRWADEGRLPTQRTEGGHRRFALADLRRLATSAPVVAKPRMGLPLAGGLPEVADSIEREDAALADAAGKVVYEGRALGWFAQERSLRARQEWARRLARAARSGDFEASLEATGVLLRQAEVSGSSLLETSLFVERFGALVGSRLPVAAPAGDRAGVHRLFTALRRHLLVGR